MALALALALALVLALALLALALALLAPALVSMCDGNASLLPVGRGDGSGWWRWVLRGVVLAYVNRPIHGVNMLKSHKYGTVHICDVR